MVKQQQGGQIVNTLYKTDAWCRFNNEASNSVCISNMKQEKINRCDTNKQSAANTNWHRLICLFQVDTDQYLKLVYICS